MPGFNMMYLMKLKQEIEKFKKGESSMLKIFKIVKYPGFVTFELSLEEKFFGEMGLQDILPKDLPQLGNENGG
jgi:hypothetical protein